MVNDWNNKSKDFKNAFYETSGLNEKQVIEMLTYGSGPKIEVANLDQDVDGDGTVDNRSQGITVSFIDSKTREIKNANNGKGLIKLDENHTVGFLENATTIGDKQAASILVESTLYHEKTHIGNIQVNKNTDGKYLESGKAFEKTVYGRDISKYNFKSYWQSTQLKPIKSLPGYVK